MASAYDPHPAREYAAIRNAAALFDVSADPQVPHHRARRSSPPGSHGHARHLQAQGRTGYYTPWCDVAGKVIDDGTVSRLDQSTYRLTSADSSLRWLHLSARGMEVSIEDVSERLGALALQGPLSRAILAQVTPADLDSLGYFRLIETTVSSIPVTISRTGYTGDLGFELWVEAARAVELWDALIETGTPYGIAPPECGPLTSRASRRADHARRGLLLLAPRPHRGADVVRRSRSISAGR